MLLLRLFRDKTREIKDAEGRPFFSFLPHPPSSSTSSPSFLSPTQHPPFPTSRCRPSPSPSSPCSVSSRPSPRPSSSGETRKTSTRPRRVSVSLSLFLSSSLTLFLFDLRSSSRSTSGSTRLETRRSSTRLLSSRASRRAVSFFFLPFLVLLLSHPDFTPSRPHQTSSSFRSTL